MFKSRTYHSQSREELILMLNAFFEPLSRFEGLAPKVLFTGNPNSAKMVGVLSAKAALDENSDIEFLLSEEGKQEQLRGGVHAIQTANGTRNFVFKHDSLTRIAPYFSEMVEAAGDSGLVICTAITKGKLSKIIHDPQYVEAFNGHTNNYDIAIDIRSEASRIKTGLQGFCFPWSRMKSQWKCIEKPQNAQDTQHRRVTIEINDATEVGQRIFEDSDFRDGFWDKTLLSQNSFLSSLNF